MLLELFQLLKPYISGFNLFGYLTLRAILAAITALVVSLLIGPPMIRKPRTRSVRPSATTVRSRISRRPARRRWAVP